MCVCVCVCVCVCACVCGQHFSFKLVWLNRTDTLLLSISWLIYSRSRMSGSTSEWNELKNAPYFSQRLSNQAVAIFHIYIYIYIYKISLSLSLCLSFSFSRVSRGCRVHNCFSAEEYDCHNECPVYDSKNSDGEAALTLELWEVPLLPSLSGPVWPGVVVCDKARSMGQIELNCLLTLNWIVWNRTVYMHKMDLT